MTDVTHPITPPIELVQQWEEDWHHIKVNIELELYIAARAAQWGADQELEACCEWLDSEWWFKYKHEAMDFVVEDLRAARRPKPPSLKEQALEKLREIHIDPEGGVTYTGLELIRRALEALPDD